ncbi:MAG: D-tyrosyl-tRNA(Tyr) deacylase [Candidatus Solibacter sp.]|nr:D-tyrosyl-tRNA(Tyr) deacylase [Candidatus Solibacter sp.]
MKLVIQRVSEADVRVGETVVGSIRTGLVVLLGISKLDTENDAEYLSDKVLGLRIFPDDSGKMNRNIAEVNGSILIVSQFTLYGDCRKGRRPSFDDAAAPERALALYNYFVETIRKSQVPVQTGTFQAMMEVRLVNQGPVTILIDSEEPKRK